MATCVSLYCYGFFPYTIVPDDFAFHFNATQYDVTISIPNGQISISDNTFLFGVKLYVNNNTVTNAIESVTNRIILWISESVSDGILFDFGSDGVLYTI